MFGFGKEMTKISVKTGDSRSDLMTIEEEKIRDLTKFDQIFIPEELKNAFGSLPFKGTKKDKAGMLVSTGGAAAISQGLYKATVNPSTLMVYKDGTIGSIQVADGKILAHAGFQSAGLAVFAPILAYQLAATITGQYYLDGINNQLSSLNSKLDELIKSARFEKEATLDVFMTLLKRLSSSDAIQAEDLAILVQKKHELSVVQSASTKALEARDPSKIQEANNVSFTGNRLTKYDELNETHNPIRDSVMIILCEKALRISDLVEIKLNVQLSRREPTRLMRIQELMASIKNWSQYEKTSRIIEAKQKDYSSTVQNTLDTMMQKAVADKSKIGTKKTEKDTRLNWFGTFFQEGQQDLSSLTKTSDELTKSLSQKVDYYISIRNGDISLLAEKK